MTLPLALIAVAAAAALAVAAMLGLRRIAPPGGAFSDSDRAPLAGVKADAVFQTWLTQTEERSRARDGRLLEARHPLPPLLWVLIAIASALLIGFVLLYADPSERARAQAMMAGSVTAVIVASALLIIFLNAPYGEGDGTIKPSAMRHALTLMQAEYVGRPPCTTNGAPAR